MTRKQLKAAKDFEYQEHVDKRSREDEISKDTCRKKEDFLQANIPLQGGLALFLEHSNYQENQLPQELLLEAHLLSVIIRDIAVQIFRIDNRNLNSIAIVLSYQNVIISLSSRCVRVFLCILVVIGIFSARVEAPIQPWMLSIMGEILSLSVSVRWRRTRALLS